MSLPSGSEAQSASGRVFATTNWSLVLAAGHGNSGEAAQALEALCRAYWPAIYVYARRSGKDSESARDMTQEFFSRLLAKGWLELADQNKGRFRTFLLTLLKRFLADQHDHATAQKRGGGQQLLSLDELAAEEERPFEPSRGLSPAEEFDRRWALATLDNSLRSLRAEAERAGQGDLFAALQSFLSGGETEGTLAEHGNRLGLGASAVKMRLHRWRARYRELLREQVAQTVPRMADLDEEMRHLLAAIAS